MKYSVFLTVNFVALCFNFVIGNEENEAESNKIEKKPAWALIRVKNYCL
jgi:hypothetical protein